MEGQEGQASEMSQLDQSIERFSDIASTSSRLNDELHTTVKRLGGGFPSNIAVKSPVNDAVAVNKEEPSSIVVLNDIATRIVDYNTEAQILIDRLKELV